MTIQHLSEVKTIARAANQIGATLPAAITAALTHLDELTRNAPVPPRAGTLAARCAEHIGDPAKLDKAFKAVAAELAAGEAAAKIHGYLAETCGARIRGMMRTHKITVTQAFGEALQSDLDTLNETARLLPAWFTEAQAADLDAHTFEIWTRARDAHARIHAASTALAPLYTAAIPQEHATHFPIAAAAALRYAQPPALEDQRAAYAVRDALAGRTERIQGTAGQGSTFVDGLFVPTALAHAGATFEWATPDEVTERALTLAAGMVQCDRVTA